VAELEASKYLMLVKFFFRGGGGGGVVGFLLGGEGGFDRGRGGGMVEALF